MENKLLDLENTTSDVLAREAVKILLEKKAMDVTMFYVKETTSVTDYYVNATGRSSTQVSALSDDVCDLIAERGRRAFRVEGRQGGAWILIDFGDVIVNVFDKPSRAFYNFDHHLPDGSKVDIAPLVAEVDSKFDINKN